MCSSTSNFLISVLILSCELLGALLLLLFLFEMFVIFDLTICTLGRQRHQIRFGNRFAIVFLNGHRVVIFLIILSSINFRVWITDAIDWVTRASNKSLRMSGFRPSLNTPNLTTLICPPLLSKEVYIRLITGIGSSSKNLRSIGDAVVDNCATDEFLLICVASDSFRIL